jgi:hypothetical protein
MGQVCKEAACQRNALLKENKGIGRSLIVSPAEISGGALLFLLANDGTVTDIRLLAVQEMKESLKLTSVWRSGTPVSACY